MSQLSERYDRFRGFVAEHVPFEPINFALQAMPVQVFLTAIVSMLGSRPEVAPHEVGGLVLDGLGIEASRFDAPAHARFGLYCEYFVAVARGIEPQK